MDYIKIKINDIEKLMYITEGDYSNGDAGFRIDILQECEIAKHEIDMGNIILNNDQLTVIDSMTGQLVRYKLIHKKALKNDIVMIIEGQELTPFKKIHNNRFFKVTRDTKKDEWVAEHCVVGYWCLYNEQYVVLERI